MSVPKLSEPLAKAIRTSEGILVWIINLGLAVGALIEPSQLSPNDAAILATVTTGLHVASRTALKIIALQQGIGVSAPVEPTGPVAGDVAEAVKAILPQALVDASHGASTSSIQKYIETEVEKAVEEIGSEDPTTDAASVPVETAAPQLGDQSALTPQFLQQLPAADGEVAP
jgi:hypothetical protein